MTRVKICGLTTESDLELVVGAGVDAVGIIVDVPVETPREVSVDRAAELADAVPPFAASVLVTMPDTVDRTVHVADAVEPDVLQLHGEFGVDELADIRERTGRSLVLAVDADEASNAGRYDGTVDAFLVDTPAEDGGGGTGRTHDWGRTKSVAANLESPVILAGGLTPENVDAAVDAVDPFAVDVASGVEAEGGIKDGDAVRSFVEHAKHSYGTEASPQP
ncbi:phosphoribosylanthranilate isomerase [Natrialba sp. INN-245]|uniref:phosphoribosylanthranilate isomerase n=1 Tax=Natrialba sp. INN-245 TaxID=2690967 RepID=UPI00131300FD|nr:phosphoribosylanthranilate isomerase [Natrialba sp. INN-245]MWV39571.1 phosphoribosylanthranilate isomerase [Natrialba sp. INN-245]